MQPKIQPEVEPYVAVVEVAYSLETALGSTPDIVLDSLLKKKNAALKHSDITTTGRDGFGHVPIFYAPVKTLEFSRPFERSMDLCLATLERIILNAVSVVPPLMVYIILPSIHSVRSQFFDPAEIKDGIFTVFPNLYENCTIDFWREDENLVELLHSLLKDLSQKKWSAIILGGMDSLINNDTYQEMIRQGNIRKLGFLEADMPGEGAAFVLLKNIGNNEAENVGVKSLNPSSMQVFSSIKIEQFDFLGSLPKDVELVISNRSNNQKSEITWYEKTKHLWVDNRPKEIHTQRWLGNLGAAQMPVMLVLGFEWLKRVIEKRKSVLFLFEGKNKIEGIICYRE